MSHFLDSGSSGQYVSYGYSDHYSPSGYSGYSGHSHSYQYILVLS